MKFSARNSRACFAKAGAIGFALSAAILAFATSAGQCQNPLKPSDFDLSYGTSSPTAEALGGSYMLSLKGPEAGSANPSQVNNDKKVAATIGLTATTTNIDVNNTESLYNNLKTLADNADTANAVSSFDSAFNDIWNYAKGAGAVPNGTDGTIGAQINPFLGASLGGRWAVVAESNAQVVTKINLSGSGSNETIAASGGAMALTSVGVPFAIPVNKITYGLYPKYLRADYIGYGFSISNNANNAINGSSDNGSYTPYTGQGTLDMDAGATTNVIPDLLDASVVVRHVFFPSFKLDGNTLNLNPEFDLGVHSNYVGFDGFAEVHNLSGANGGSVTDHLGVEKDLGGILQLRAGLDDGKFVYGAGLNLFVVRIDVAAGPSITQRAGISAELKF